MSFEVTQNTISASKETNLKPNIILKIEGISTLFGGVEILEVIRYGQNDIEYGQAGLVYGGSIPILDQSTYISFGGTSSEIRQTLQLDKGLGESVSNLTVALIDKNSEITNIISPGKVITDILGTRCKVYFGFANTNFPEDYITIFRGIVQSIDSKPGQVSLNLSHPDQKKRSTVFTSATTQLNGAIGAGDTTITVDSTTSFLSTIVGPDGSTTDADFSTYIRIDDEVMQYTGKTATTFTGVTRGAFNTTAASHSDNASVASIYRLGGNGSASNGLTLALKLMLSGENTFQFTNIPITNFVRIDAGTTVTNSIFFSEVDVSREYNIQVGDFIETTGASNGANNVSPSTTIKVSGVVQDTNGSYITVSGVSFVEENETSAVMKIRSQFDVWPDGLFMKPDEVDITEHENIRNTFLPSFGMDFRLDDEINGKEFLSEQIYNPMSAFSLPRKSQSSVGIHVPPLPNQDIIQLNINNVLSPSDIKISRSTSKNITNTIVYKFDEDVLDNDKFRTNTLSINQTAIDQVGVGRKAQVIEARGMREIDSGTTLATAASARRLKKYAFGAEFLEGVKISFRDGYRVEVGDKVILDFSSLKLSDIRSGTRAGESRIMEIVNKRLNFKKGSIVIDLVDTNFDNDSRFGLIAPSSKIKSASSSSSWVIKESFGSRFGINEFQKWENFVGAKVRIVSPDFVTRSGIATLVSVAGNSITVDASGVGFTPLADDIMLYSKYSDQIKEEVKIIYVHLSNDVANFGDGGTFYGLF